MVGIIKSPGASWCCGRSRPCANTATIHAQEGIHLGPIDALWHILNLFGPAAGLGLIATTLAKLLWRGELKGVAWGRLALYVFAACALVTVVGLAIFGHDGKMVTYAAMIVACTLTLWRFGFAARSR